jgi:two-component system sensor histidine kinase ArlS
MIMPVRLRITLLFVVLDIVILGVLCSGIYYFFYTAREKTIKTRLTNRAITTARLLGQKEIFDRRLVQRIDSLTTAALKNKTVQAYDYQNREIYTYTDNPGDTVQVSEEVLEDARVNQIHFFRIANKEAVAYNYTDNDIRIVVVSAAEDVEGMQTINVLKKILLVTFLAGNAIILIAGYVFSNRLLSPIKKITADVKEISAQNLTRRIKTGKSKDEWYQLANTLNDLLNRLQESFELQRRFISNASHELSTPLTSISSQLEVAFQREREASEYKTTMKSIYQDVRHMSKLTKTLLEFAKASGNVGGLEISLIRIDEVILTLPSEIAKVNPKYSVALRFYEPPENEHDLLVFGNEELLFTAVKNIVLNACKYSDNNQAIVKLEVADEQIAIYVDDEGKGIPQSELRTIFQPFYRAEQNTPGEGFGLGLSLAERIIKLHKGFIEVNSQLGVGTQFVIFLPTAKSLR